jgi:hypothetical protein
MKENKEIPILLLVNYGENKIESYSNFKTWMKQGLSITHTSCGWGVVFPLL